jgi:hypothetical protein
LIFHPKIFLMTLGDLSAPRKEFGVCPLTALDYYQKRFGWPVFASTSAIWLRLPVGMAAFEVAEGIAVPPYGPVIACADGRSVLLARCRVVASVGTRCPYGIHDIAAPGVQHLGHGETVVLPPTDGALWRYEPESGWVLPACAAIATALALPER